MGVELDAGERRQRERGSRWKTEGSNTPWQVNGTACVRERKYKTESIDCMKDWKESGRILILVTSTRLQSSLWSCDQSCN